MHEPLEILSLCLRKEQRIQDQALIFLAHVAHTAPDQATKLCAGKGCSNCLGNLTYIRWESRRGMLAAEHASSPGCVCEDSPPCKR